MGGKTIKHFGAVARDESSFDYTHNLVERVGLLSQLQWSNIHFSPFQSLRLRGGSMALLGWSRMHAWELDGER